MLSSITARRVGGVYYFPLGSTLFWLALIFVVANSVVMQGLSGQSLGKRVLHLQLGRPVTTGPGWTTQATPGVVRCFFRTALALVFLVFGATMAFLGPIIAVAVMFAGLYYQTPWDRAAKTIVMADDDLVLERDVTGPSALP